MKALTSIVMNVAIRRKSIRKVIDCYYKNRTESKKQRVVGRQIKMTKLSSERLSKGDLKFLLKLLDKAEIESHGD